MGVTLFSNARIIVKIALFLAASLISFLFLLRGLFNSTPLVMVSILTMLFLPPAHPAAAYMWMAVIGGVGVAYTLSRILPAILLMGVVMILFLAGYTGFLVVVAYRALDAPAFTVFLSVLYLFWYGWVHEYPRLRYV